MIQLVPNNSMIPNAVERGSEMAYTKPRTRIRSAKRVSRRTVTGHVPSKSPPQCTGRADWLLVPKYIVEGKVNQYQKIRTGHRCDGCEFGCQYVIHCLA